MIAPKISPRHSHHSRFLSVVVVIWVGPRRRGTERKVTGTTIGLFDPRASFGCVAGPSRLRPKKSGSWRDFATSRQLDSPVQNDDPAAAYLDR